MKKTVVITGAAENLGGLLAQSMIDDEVELRLLIHRKNINADLADRLHVKIYRVDLADASTFREALRVLVNLGECLFLIYRAAVFLNFIPGLPERKVLLPV